MKKILIALSAVVLYSTAANAGAGLVLQQPIPNASKEEAKKFCESQKIANGVVFYNCVNKVDDEGNKLDEQLCFCDIKCDNGTDLLINPDNEGRKYYCAQ